MMDKKRNSIAFLTDRLEFPSVETANREGLLAVGGDLSPERLLLAYRNGIFPWFNEDSLILWWSPDPRMVLYPEQVRISKSMKRLLNAGRLTLTRNTRFREVIDHCASVFREGQDGTWITEEMKTAYLELNRLGVARSLEVWEGTELVGGLYGVDLGHVFCGESMFSLRDNASKFAFIHLALEAQQNHYALIDCQMYTRHLGTLGAEEIPRADYIRILQQWNPQ